MTPAATKNRFRIFVSLLRACIPGAVAISAAFSAAAGDDVLFRAGFDGFSVLPERAADRRTLAGSIGRDLQLRMHPDVSGKRGNALTLTTPETVAYPASGNFRPDRGSVSFWVKPVNYDLAEVKYFQVMFRVVAEGFTFTVQKYRPKSNQLAFGIGVAGRNHTVKGAAAWKEGEWHKVDVVWDPGSMALYVDGRPPPTVADSLPSIVIEPPLEMPRTLKGGVFGLNYSPGWQFIENGRITAFDCLEIRSRKLSSREIFEAFAAKRPDLAKGKRPADVKEDASAKLSYRSFPGERRLSVRVFPGDAAFKRTGDIPVELKLAEVPSGKTVARSSATLPDIDSYADLVYGDGVKEGRDYEVSAVFPGEDVSARAAFRACRLDFIRERAGLGDSVPSPWTPLTAGGDGREFSLLDRVYVFKDGIFPVSVKSRGAEVFAQSPVLELNGRPVEWKAARVVTNRADKAVLTATGRCAHAEVSGSAELWFDGFLKLDFSLTAPGGGELRIDSLRLRYTLDGGASRYILAPSYKPWKNGRFDGRFGVGRNDLSLLWLTGPERGLAWWCESRRNWSSSGDDVRAVRNGKGCEVSIDVVSRPEKTTAKVSYTMGLQATPVKRPDRLYRVRYNARFAKAPREEGDWSSCGWASHSGVKRPDNVLHWTSLKPTHPEAFAGYLEGMKAMGRDILVYTMPMHFSPLDPEWDMFSGEWLKNPGIRWDYVDETTRRRSHVAPCCGNTAAADWHAANAKALFERFPHLAGLYYDISSVGDCGNRRHGHGGVDAFGRSYTVSNALGLRGYFIRIVRLCRRYRRRLHVHAHNLYFPFVHSLADSCCPGEERYSGYVSDPVHHYQEGIPAEEYESAFNSDVMGMNVYFIPQNDRALQLQPEIVNPRKEDFTGPRAVMATVMPSLVYDFACKHVFGEFAAPLLDIRRKLKPLAMRNATYTGYWQTRALGSAPGVRTGMYLWKRGEGPCRFMLAAGNFSRERLPCALSVDWKAFGLEAPGSLVDLVSGRRIALGQLADFGLDSYALALFVPAGCEDAANKGGRK